MKTNYLILTNKHKNILKLTAVSAISGLLIIPTGCSGISEKIYEDYSTNQQIETIAKHLNFNTEDAFLFENQCGRFIHNNGKPIQVVVKPELKKYMTEIKSALDTMVGILHSINDKYSYEIVEKANSSISTITFESGVIERDFTIGCVNSFSTTFSASKLDNKKLISQGSIVIDLEKYKDLDNYMQCYIMNHELAHLFGLLSDQYTYGDIKCTDKHKGNTFIKVEIGSKINMMTPYDISSALCQYTPQAKSKEDLQEKIAFCKDYLANYEEQYYEYYSQRTKELITNCSSTEFSFSEFDLNEDFEFSYSVSAEDKGKSYACNYEITYQDNNYTLKIFDEYGKLLDECSGDTILKNNVMVLKGVELKNGLRPNNLFEPVPIGYIQDLTLFKNNENVYMYDCSENSINYGTTDYIEHDLTL